MIDPPLRVRVSSVAEFTDHVEVRLEVVTGTAEDLMHFGAVPPPVVPIRFRTWAEADAYRPGMAFSVHLEPLP